MPKRISNSERNRQKKKHQLNERRDRIIDAAQRLFLKKGLESTNMRDVAKEAKISKVTLYRYFPDRHPIAFEVAVRMLRQIHIEATVNIPKDIKGLDAVQMAAQNIILNFNSLRDAYRYIGMFDNLYAREYPTEELASWYKQQIKNLSLEFSIFNVDYGNDQSRQAKIITFSNLILSFLEKMAARGDLMGNEQEVPLDLQLEILKRLIRPVLTYIFKEKNNV
jgi:AcrR family transcriptional regulator